MKIRKSKKIEFKEWEKEFNKKSSKYKLYYSDYEDEFIIRTKGFFGTRIIEINNDYKFTSNVYLKDYNDKIIWERIKGAVKEFESIFNIEVEITLD